MRSGTHRSQTQRQGQIKGLSQSVSIQNSCGKWWKITWRESGETVLTMVFAQTARPSRKMWPLTIRRQQSRTFLWHFLENKFTANPGVRNWTGRLYFSQFSHNKIRFCKKETSAINSFISSKCCIIGRRCVFKILIGGLCLETESRLEPWTWA